MKHYIYFKGHEVKHYLIGKVVSNTYFEGLTIVEDFTYERLQKGVTDAHFGGSNYPIVFSKDYTLYNKHIVDVEWHDMIPSEKRKYNKVLKDNNLGFKTHTFVGKSLYGSYTKDVESLRWIDTEKIPISVNGEIMTYAEFKTLTFGDNINVINSWDNGYSHWGEKTNKMKSVYDLFDYICPKDTEGGEVHCGEFCTWQFDGHGVLQLRLTEQEFHHSFVSNT